MMWAELLMLLGLGLVVFAISFAYGRREAQRNASETADMKERLDFALAEIADLRTRVRVLETLATDEERRIARDIAGLRDQQGPPRAAE
ncbi:MAG: hypothetical protein R3C52_06110 [Hyphomonadaceae bacterium]